MKRSLFVHLIFNTCFWYWKFVKKNKKTFEKHRKKNTFQFFIKYIVMVTILFKSINSSRSRICLGHLNTLEKIILHFTAMGRIKYHGMFSVYLPDGQVLHKKDLEENNLEVFRRWTFFCTDNIMYRNWRRTMKLRSKAKS